MRILALLLSTFAVLLAQQPSDHPGDFNIRFEPDAKLQTNAEIPFRVIVTDPLHKPLIDAKVTLQIELKDGSRVKVYKAPAVGQGVYVAKPIFPVGGEWQVYVEVRRDQQMSAREIDFTVPD